MMINSVVVAVLLTAGCWLLGVGTITMISVILLCNQPTLYIRVVPNVCSFFLDSKRIGAHAFYQFNFTKK